jgi:hypothetical protein
MMDIPPEEFKRLYQKIVQKPWFTRVWVLQELVLSVNPWLQCGTGRIKWDVFLQHILPPTSSLLRIELDPNILPLMDMHETRDKRRRMGQKKYDGPPGSLLWDIMVARRGFAALDPKDMVYAHLGMADLEKQNQIPIDYNKSCVEVYEDIARQSLHGDATCLFCFKLESEKLKGAGASLPGFPTGQLLSKRIDVRK